MTGMLKNECDEHEAQGYKKWNNHQNLFLFATRSYVCFFSFGVHKSMNAKSKIKKLQKVSKKKEVQKSETLMEIGRRSRSGEKKRNRRRIKKSKKYWNAKHSAISNKVVITFTIIFRV
jgi:hypothetical protein